MARERLRSLEAQRLLRWNRSAVADALRDAVRFVSERRCKRRPQVAAAKITASKIAVKWQTDAASTKLCQMAL